MTHKEKLEEIEEFLTERKNVYVNDIRFYIEQDESGLLNEESKHYQQMAEAGILFVEEMGRRFFNWE
jgi:hypothetical protein